MAHIVTAPLVIAKKQDGSDLYLYKDAVLPGHVSDSEVKRLKALGFIDEVDDASVAADPDDEDAAHKARSRRKPISESN